MRLWPWGHNALQTGPAWLMKVASASWDSQLHYKLLAAAEVSTGQGEAKEEAPHWAPQCFRVLPLRFQGTAMEKEGKEVRNRGGPTCHQLQASMGSSRPGRSILFLLFSIDHDCYSSGATSSLSLLLSTPPTPLFVINVCSPSLGFSLPSFLSP